MRKVLLLVPLCLVLLVPISGGQAGANSKDAAKSKAGSTSAGQPAPGRRPANLGDCLVTWTTADAGGTTVCISSHGNILQYESPTGYEHIGVGQFSEGYVLCYTNPFTGNTVNVWDTGASESGFGEASASAMDTDAPVVLTRTTSDRIMTLTQVFAFNGLNKSLTIEMQVHNNTPRTVNDVILRRQVDFDIDSGGANGWANYMNDHAATNRDGVFAWNDPSSAPIGFEAHGMILRHLSENTDVSHVAKVTDDILDSTCDADSAVVTPRIGFDDGDTLEYALGSLNPNPVLGSSKAAYVQYERY